MKIIIPIAIEVDVKCGGDCSDCKWGQKPSTCAPYNDWIIKRKQLAYEIMSQVNKYFGVENKKVDD